MRSGPGPEAAHPPAWRPHVAAFAAITAWGLSFVATKVALEFLSPATVIFTRFALGVAVLHGILLARGLPLRPPAGRLGSLVLMGFIGIFVHQMLQVHGLERTTAVRTGWLIGLIPIWSALIGATFLRERLGLRRVVGLVLGFAGAVLVVTRGRLSGELLGLPQTTGDFLVLASTLNWAIFTAIGGGTIRELGSTRAITGSMLAGWILLTPLWVVRRGWEEYAALPASGWVAVLFLGLVCSGLAYLAWYEAMRRLPTTSVSAYLYLEPLVTLLAAVAWLGEPVAVTTITGGLVVLLGVYLVQRG